MTVTIHEPLARVQYKCPEEDVKPKLAVPVGCEVGEEVSVTATVHRVGWLTTSVEGLQLTTVILLSGPVGFTTAMGVPFRAETGMSPHIWLFESVTLLAFTQPPNPLFAAGSQYWSMVPADAAEFVMHMVAVPVPTPLT